MMVKVKICGITNVADAVAASTSGADALGFNFYPSSPRYIEPEMALPIRMSLPPFVAAVGVFVNAEPQEVRRIMEYCRLDCAQLHGRETPQYVDRLAGLHLIKAIRVRDEKDLAEIDRYAVDAFLLDAFVPDVLGGTGQTLDWDLARQAASRARVILAGGLTPENVAEAIHAARPYGVDVASGVEEAPGYKDREMVEWFIREAKSVYL